MNSHLAFATLSVAFGIAGILPYIFDIFAGRARPNIVTWAGWGLLTGIGAAAQIADRTGLSFVVPLYSTVNSLIVVVLGLKYGHAKFTALDKLCFALGMLAISCWLLTSEPFVGLVLAVGADMIIATPNLVKTYKDPSSETPLPWFLWGASALCGIAALTSFTFESVLFSGWLLASDTFVAILALRGKFRKDIRAL